MLKLIKFLKKSTKPIIFILILLIIQATCELSLPEYTSRIVNIGIQQGGINRVTPDVIRETTFNKTLFFLNEKDKNIIYESYQKIDKDKLTEKGYNYYKDKYSIIDEESIYVLKDIPQVRINKLNTLLNKPLMIIGGISSDSEEMQAIKTNIIGKLGNKMSSDKEVDFFTLMNEISTEQRKNILAEINNKTKDLPDSIITQGAIAFVKQEYKEIGIDVNKMQTNYILFSGSKMLALSLLAMTASILVGLLGAKVAASVAKTLRSRVFEKVVSFSKTELKKFSTASLITRSTNDIQQVQMVLVFMLRIVIYAPILGIGGLIKVLNTNTSMAWIIGLAVSVIFSVVTFLFIVVIPKFKLIQKLIDKLNLVSREILTGLPVIRAFSTQKYEEKRFDEANQDLMKTNLFVNRVMAFMMPAMMFVMNAVAVLIVWRGAHNIDSGAMQVGDMMAFIQYTMQIIMAFLMISMVSIILPRASVSAVRIDEVLTTDNIILDPKDPLKLDSNKTSYVEFKNVTFRYPDADADVISNINFTAKPGEVTAFIGSTGSGKSTLINLIPRFFDITKGSILINGVDIRNISQHDLRSKIGYVPQKGVLFSGTIASNIRYGDENINEKTMKKAADIAQATEFIDLKKDKFKSTISQGGSNVSGGQKQRLSIARAIAINPEIYIFDDSFSALDFKTDANLRNALKNETKNSTVLIVAQRVSTIMHADQIIVLEKGKVVGKGTHKELLKKCSVYKQIAASQLSKEELAHE